MSKTLRVGIIGCGKIAHVDHAPAYKAIPGVRIVSLLDIYRKKIDALRRAYAPDALGFTDLDAFLGSGLDAVSICTPNYLHYPQTLAALKAGLHVLCEKPMAATPSQTTRMIEAARKAKKILQINQTLHYVPLYVRMAELVASGAIGRPIHIRCLRAGGTSPDKGWSPGARWFVSKACAGGIILDIGVHMAEIMQTIVGPIAEVAAYVDTRSRGIDVPDNVAALFRFDNGATGVLELSWTIPAGGGMLEIYGTEGTLRQGFSRDHPIEILYPIGKKKSRAVYPKLKKKIRNSQRCFVDAIRGKGPSPTPGELGREAVALCHAIARSGESGRFVRVQRF